jgi:hypothetical protein
MATQGARSLSITFTGDVTFSQVIAAANNASSPGENQLINLAATFNSIAVPVSGGVAPTAVTIIPPAGNTQALTLKGVTGDIGIPLHLTDPGVIPLASGTTAIGITAGGVVTGMRLIWT